MLIEIAYAQSVQAGSKSAVPADYSGITVQLKKAYESESIDFRNDNVQNAMKKLVEIHKDDFYAKTLDEMLVTQDR